MTESEKIMREGLTKIDKTDAPHDHRREIRFVDATPDDGFPIRILQAYKETGMFTDNTLGMDPENELCKKMNEWQAQRNVILDRAIKKLVRGEQ